MGSYKSTPMYWSITMYPDRIVFKFIETYQVLQAIHVGEMMKQYEVLRHTYNCQCKGQMTHVIEDESIRQDIVKRTGITYIDEESKIVMTRNIDMELPLLIINGGVLTHLSCSRFKSKEMITWRGSHDLETTSLVFTRVASLPVRDLQTSLCFIGIQTYNVDWISKDCITFPIGGGDAHKIPDTNVDVV